MTDSSRPPFYPSSSSGSGSGGWVSPASESQGGQQIGLYRTLHELGRGAFGVVYLAQHTSQGHQVALKLMLDPRNKEELQRFFREGELAGRLNHPGIVRVLDRGVHQNLPWLAMEYCPGTNLGERLLMGALSVPKACELIAQVAEALEAAHAEGVIHRDLKPANVLLGVDGRPRITDFGLARGIGNAQLTRSGDGLGSPLYMPPEQFQDAKHVDERADVYALGLLLYEALTGRQPFEGSTVLEISEAIHTGRSVPLRTRRADVPSWLAAVCERAFAREAAERFPSARAFREALLAGDPAERLRQPPAAPRLRPSARARLQGPPPPPARSTSKIVLAGIAVGLALAAAVAVGIQLSLQRAAAEEALDVARAWVQKGSLPEARRALDHAREVGGRDPELERTFGLLAGLSAAEAALERGDPRAARELVAEDAPPSSLAPWRKARLARLNLQLRVSDATQDLLATRELDDTIQALILAEDVSTLRDRLAQELLAGAQERSRGRAKLEDVLALLERAARVASDPAVVDAVRLEEASVHFRRGRFARATELAGRLASRPGRLGLQAAYVAAYGKVWRDALQREGLEELRELWQRDREGPVGLNAGAVWHSHSGMNPEGEQLALESLARDPDYVDAYISLAFCRSDQYFKTKDPGFLERSIEASSRAIELQPDHPRAYLARAYATGNRGEGEASLAAYDDVIALTEPRPMARALRHRATRRYAADQPHAALEDVERALERNPNSVEGLMLRGALRYDLGHRQEAGADWVLAYRLSPRELQAYLGRYRREIQEQVIAALEAASAPRPGQPR